MANEEKVRLCPKCQKELKKVSIKGKRMIFECSEHGLFRATVKRKKDMTNSRNWKATCIQCGGKMDYFNFKYCCRKCGHILEV